MTLADVIAAGEALQEDLGREYYLTGAGHKLEPAFQAIYDRYDSLLGDDALHLVRESGSLVLLEWLIELRTGRRTAHLDEKQLVWEQNKLLDVNGQSVSYLRAPIELANSQDRVFRIALDKARSGASAKELDDLRRERFRLEHQVMAQLGIGGYVETLAALTGIDFKELSQQAVAFLAASQDMYSECLEHLVRRRLGLHERDLVRADVAWTFRADAFDRAFDPDTMLETSSRQMGEMGLDIYRGGYVRFDTGEREGKQPRAFCVPVKVPTEVYLVLRPQGGHVDYRTFWHELGHAMHFASPAPEMPFEARWLGDNSVTEGYAMLWDHLTLDRKWLERYVELSAHEVGTLVRDLAVHELYLLRRYAAKLIYELALHESDFEGVDPLYSEKLTEATRFRYSEDDCLSDVDPALYCARYLRAWQLQAMLTSVLRDRFDSDWFRNPRAGSFVSELMGLGQAQPANELALSVVGTSLTFEPILERVEETLS